VRFPTVDHDAELSEEEFRLLRDFIHEQFGLYFDDSHRASLRGRLTPRLALLGLATFEDYYRYLRFAPDRGEEQQRMVSHLTNNETYFFREQPQLTVFSSHVLRELKERKQRAGEHRLSILSAGCSTGEEPQTLAMILFDSGHFFWGWDIRLTGLDVDGPALDTARRGLYHQNSLRAVTPPLLERHFTREGEGVRVREPVRKAVSFRAGNLLDPSSYEGLAPLDVIFCRNVLIYFSDSSVQRAVSLFHRLLAPGGYLFLGHAESLARVTSSFVPIRFQGAIIYQKPLEAKQKPVEVRA
jgi:chemotaxis protein methyltransferase CheR